MIGNKNKATFILGLVAVSFFSSYPFRHTFIGGLLTGGFGSAMIGGLADWFAVTALFRRPLGIPFRTAIIPRNRQKIFQALVHMVENQLLMKENIKSKLDEYDIAGSLVKVMIEHDGKSILKRMLYSFMREMLVQVKPTELGKLIEDVVRNTVRKAPIALDLIVMTEWFIKKGYDNKIVNFILRQCSLFAARPQIQLFFTQIFIAARKRYEHGMTRRKVFNQLLQLSPEEVGRIGQETLIAALAEIQDEKHVLRQRWKIWLQQWLVEKKTDVVFQRTVEEWMIKFIDQAQLAQHGEKYITEFLAEALVNNRKTVKWLEILMLELDKRMIKLSENEEERRNFDQGIKNMLSKSLDNYHDEIGNMVMANLNKFTDDMLVKFIEDKVGNDLQMIRINGSVVGGLVGMVLYLITFLL